MYMRNQRKTDLTLFDVRGRIAGSEIFFFIVWLTVFALFSYLYAVFRSILIDVIVSKKSNRKLCIVGYHSNVERRPQSIPSCNMDTFLKNS